MSLLILFLRLFATSSGFSGSNDTLVPGALLKSIPASEAGFKACFQPYNCKTTSLCALVSFGSFLRFFIVLFLILRRGPKIYPQIYLLQITARNLALRLGLYLASSINLPCETDIGVSAITK